MTARDPMIAGRIEHVRDICANALEFDNRHTDLPEGFSGWTDRQWLAQSVLNILNGKIDAQIVDEINRTG